MVFCRISVVFGSADLKIGQLYVYFGKLRLRFLQKTVQSGETFRHYLECPSYPGAKQCPESPPGQFLGPSSEIVTSRVLEFLSQLVAGRPGIARMRILDHTSQSQPLEDLLRPGQASLSEKRFQYLPSGKTQFTNPRVDGGVSRENVERCLKNLYHRQVVAVQCSSYLGDEPRLLVEYEVQLASHSLPVVISHRCGQNGRVTKIAKLDHDISDSTLRRQTADTRWLPRLTRPDPEELHP